MDGQIFLSYRRQDSEGSTGRLYDQLTEYFDPKQIFMDVDTIEPGLDFVDAIETAVGSCDVLLAIIGKKWIAITDESGKRRLDNPMDFVRVEIASALKRHIRVIPVLVQGASMPDSEDLPDELKPLARRNAIELSHTRFKSDVERLVHVLQGTLQPEKTPSPNAAKVSVPVARGDETANPIGSQKKQVLDQTRPPSFTAIDSAKPRRSIPGWFWAVVAGLLTVTIAASLYTVFGNPVKQGTPVPPSRGPDVSGPAATSGTCQDRLAFVSDVTIPDGTVIEANKTFTKTWRIKNDGTCTWTTDYRLAFQMGKQMGATNMVSLKNNVSPGVVVDLSVEFTAPSTSGSYKSFWQLQNGEGIVVPVNGVPANFIFVDITVSDPNVLLYDDFSDKSSGWPVFGGPNEKSEVAYKNGFLSFTFYKAPCGFDASWSPNGYGDFIVETVFSTPADVPGAGAGFTLRANDKSWYLLWIYPAQGSYLFQKDINGKVTQMVPLINSPAIRPVEKDGRYSLKLKVEARGGKFDISVGQPDLDYEPLNMVSDSELSSGHVGPSAVCPEKSFTPPVEVLFDWIRISK